MRAVTFDGILECYTQQLSCDGHLTNEQEQRFCDSIEYIGTNLTAQSLFDISVIISCMC